MFDKNTNLLKFAVAVAVACLEEERPKGDNVTAEEAKAYVSNLLSLILYNTGIEYNVSVMRYPKCAKIPLIIDLYGIDQCLFWYYPNESPGELILELEGAIYATLSDIICISA